MARKMKPSGIDWLGDIPADWKICRIKNLASIFTGNSIKDEHKKFYEDPVEAIPYISTKDIDTTLQTINFSNGMYVKLSDESFRRAPAHSTLLCIEGGSAGKKIAYTAREVCFVNKLCCFHSKSCSNKYLYYYLMSPAFTQLFNSHISGLIGGVSIKELNDFKIILPPLDEQHRIAAFLDSECSRIDSVVGKTRASIEEYKKLKQAIITRAVTKGIRPARPMKNSGVEWIGEIPATWTIERIKHLGSYRNGLTYNPNNIVDEGQGTLVLRSSNVQQGKLCFNDNVYVNIDIPERFMVQKGDIIICSRNGSRELIGKCAIIEDETNATFGAFMMIFRCESPKYMYYILNSYVFKYYLSTFITSTINQLTGGNFGNMEIVWCANKDEQREISAYLDEKCAAIDRLISKKGTLLTELESYKKSLIFEYVTGKKEAPE